MAPGTRCERGGPGIAGRGSATDRRRRTWRDVLAGIGERELRIAPGVIAIKEGAWYSPDAHGTDRGGCGNVLSADRSAPCGATTYNTNQVEVELATAPGKPTP